MSLLAVDIGSSACKAVLFANNGEILSKSVSRYTPYHPDPSIAELDPDIFWQAICCVSRSVVENTTDPVQALCLSSHGETFVLLDSQGQPKSRAILNQDFRAADETRWCEDTIGRRRLFEITGLAPNAMYPIPKIIWLRRHTPELFSPAPQIVHLIGYILNRMGFLPLVDYSLASRFLAFDIRHYRWSSEILDALDLRADQFPTAVPSGTIAGKLGNDIARELGLPVDTLVVLGGHDQPCAALGMGVIDAGRISDSMGTYECVLASSDEPCLSDRAFDASLNSYCHVLSKKFVTLAYFPSGIMVSWLYDFLYRNFEGDSAQGLERERYAALEGSSPDGPTGLCITPHLIGTGNPEFNSHVAGAIIGLRPGTTPGRVFKGILEGLACELSLVTTLLTGTVGEFTDICVSGGGSRSALGLRLRAALTGCRLHLMKSPEAVCLGTAILAGVAAGEFRNPSEAVDLLVRDAEVIAPDPLVAVEYAHQLERYRSFRSLIIEHHMCRTRKEEL